MSYNEHLLKNYAIKIEPKTLGEIFYDSFYEDIWFKYLRKENNILKQNSVKMKTALQQFKDKLEFIKANTPSNDTDNRRIIAIYTFVLFELKEFEELEKKQLEDAFIDGQFAVIDCKVATMTADEWYDKTYNNNV